LYEMNVSLACFEITIDEIRRILDAACHDLRDYRRPRAAGLHSVYEHFLSTGTRTSDVELIIANLERSIKRLHIRIKPRPPHTLELGLNETRLEQIVSEEMPHQREDARHHDIDCLTAVHRLREGKTYNSIEHCKYVFVTTNNALAVASARFFIEEYERVPTPLCINDHTLSTLAWVKNPKYAAEFSRHRLIADSFAALRPNAELSRRYLEEINRLRDSGAIDDNDYHLLRFSTVARNALLDATFGSPDAFTEGTVPEILERARANARQGLEDQLARETQLRGAAEREAQDAARRLTSARDTQAARLDELARKVGQALGLSVYGLALILFALGLWATFPSILPQLPQTWRTTIRILISLFAALTLWSIAAGGTIRALARWVEVRSTNFVSRRLRILLPPLISSE